MESQVSRVLSRFKYQRLGSDNWQRSIRTRKFRRASDPNKSTSSRRRSWRIRLPKKFRVKLSTPKSWLLKLRDAYINMMLSFSAKRNSTGMVMGPHLSSLSSITGLGSRNDAMSNKDLQRLYTAYIQRAVAEGRLMLADSSSSR